MMHTAWTDLAAWWATVPPEFAFLLGLPFAVAALGLWADGRKDGSALRKGASPPR